MIRLSRASTLLATLSGLLLTACNSSTTSTTAAPSTVRCALTISGTPPIVDGGGGSGTVALSIPRECTWSAKPEVDWITVSPPSGQGESQVSFSVASNPQPTERKGGIVINERRIEVTQRAACAFTLSPTRGAARAHGARLLVTVTAPAGCAWRAVSQAPWITVSAGASGEGPGTVTLEVSASGGEARTGEVLIANIPFSVRQSEEPPESPAPLDPPAPPSPPGPPGPPNPTCQVSLSASSAAIGSTGGSGSVDVIAASGCEWTAQSSAPWLDVTSGGTGVGPGVVQFTASQNTSSAQRTATLTIAGVAFTLTQAGAAQPCSFTVSPSTVNAPASGLSGNITVTASASSCGWTATSSPSWIDLTGPTQGTGNATVAFSVAVNTSTTSRTGTIAIGGADVAVSQSGASLGPPTVSGVISSLQGQCPTLTFVVMGRTVRTTSATRFRAGSCSTIDDGDDVTVEGTVETDNSITATSVRKN